ncbi:MAG: S8/S53 family peptidase [Gluconacetobacter diazotrophicus]|nr:S8/S53 family peptidase [Gluconacetobacter diazotrophicus]
MASSLRLRFGLLATAAVIGLGGGTAARAAATATTSGWATTATQGLTLDRLAGPVDLGPVAGTDTVTVRVGLAPHDTDALLALVQAAADPASPGYGQYLTPAQYAAQFGPTPAQIAAVTGFLRDSGLNNIVVEPNGLLVSATGSAAAVSQAFNTPLERVAVNGVTGFVNTAPAQVPAALGGIVSAVLGLNTIGRMTPQLALPSLPLPQYLVSYGPKQFQHIYGADGTVDGGKSTIAIMAEGNMTQVVADLRTQEAKSGVPVVPVSVVQVGLASPDVSGADEWDMDTQYSSGMANNLKRLFIYTTTSLSDSDLALEFSRWASDGVAQAASASLGECEAFPYLDGAMTVDDMIFLEAAAQGQTFFASSGDTGSQCAVLPTNGTPVGAPLVEYPAASPYVVGVGGTTLFTNPNGNYDTEISWNTGGGGLSQFESAPFWQKAANAVLNTTGFRGVPDIGLDADPNSGASVIVNGTAEGVGGTSLSSPLALGAWARMLSNNRKLGFASLRLYGLYDGSTVVGTYPLGGFHDVTVGNNGLYSATAGYDLNTGLGTPWVNQMQAALAK